MEQTKFTGSDSATGSPGSLFGKSCSINGNYIIVGSSSHNSNQGKSYIFKRSGSTWIEQETLVGSNISATANFGNTVSISENYIIVGANSYSSSQGNVYIYNHDLLRLPIAIVP